MPDLTFQVRGAEAMQAAASPALALQLEIHNRPAAESIQSVLLNCQIQIEAARRRYGSGEHERLRDLFGEPERWGQTLRPLYWTHLTTIVPGFTGSLGVTLAVPCPSDFSLPATKYFYGVEDDAVPITLLFSGTVFYRTEDKQLQVSPIPWNAEARFGLPAAVWRECMELHYPNTTWLGLRRDVFERLYDFKVRNGLATLDEAVERMMEQAPEVKDLKWTAR